MKYLFLDTESLSKGCLVTGHMAVTDEDFNILGQYGFMLKHDQYVVDPSALMVNRIRILDHHSVSIETTEISAGIKQFLKKHATYERCGIKPGDDFWYEIERLQPVGHGIRGDLKLIADNFPDCNLDKYVRRNVIDTLDIARAAECWGVLEGLENIKLETLANHFGLFYHAHVAYEDVKANIHVMQQLKMRFKLW